MFRTLGIVKGALLTERQRHHLARRLEGKSVLEWVVRQVTDCELLSGVVVLADEGSEGDTVPRRRACLFLWCAEHRDAVAANSGAFSAGVVRVHRSRLAVS